jgi:hypothetical protein
LSDTTDSKNYSNNFENIDKTPFTIINNGEKYYGIIGKHRITELYVNKEELKKDLTEITWDRICQVIWAIVEKFQDVEKINEVLTKEN